jgi:hypothetical protein
MVLGAFVALLAAALAAPPARAQSIHVALTPPVTSVAVGDTFNIDITVMEPGLAFNAYDAVVTYDPSVLTFLQRSPISLQEGTYMKSACGNTFHRFTAAGDSLVIAHSLLCAGVSLTGPGQLYRLHFRADHAGDTWVRFRPGRLKFYNEGIRITPVVSDDALVSSNVVGVVPPATTTRLALASAPNPAPGGETTFTVESPLAGPQEVTIHDARGRRVQTLDLGSLPAGAHRVAWNGRDAQGRRVAPGLYLATLRTPGGTTSIRIALTTTPTR